MIRFSNHSRQPPGVRISRRQYTGRCEDDSADYRDNRQTPTPISAVAARPPLSPRRLRLPPRPCGCFLQLPPSRGWGTASPASKYASPEISTRDSQLLLLELKTPHTEAYGLVSRGKLDGLRQNHGGRRKTQRRLVRTGSGRSKMKRAPLPHPEFLPSVRLRKVP